MKKGPLVVVESVEDLFFYALQGEIISGLRLAGDVRVGRWVSNSLSLGASRSLRLFVGGWLSRLIFSRLKWKKLYDAFCSDDVARADSLRMPWQELSYAWTAWRIFRALKSKEQLAAVRVGGILVGDLVIDSYLRFKPTAGVDTRDWYLFAVLRQAVKDVDTVRAYFLRVKPSLYLTTYTTYFQHGVPVRMAVALGIPAWSFANAQEFGTRLTPDHFFQSRRCGAYSDEFAALPDQQEKITRAADFLGGRVSGTADTVTANQLSAYQIKTQDVPDVQGAAVVFLHDFYDSPHIYSWMIFHDFWEWACTTIEILRATGQPFVLKPHPNQRAESRVALDDLRNKYPGISFISPEVSNRQLVDGGMACAITVYGSVAAEMAFLGVPSISCGESPHVSFDAFHLATSKDEYLTLVRNFSSLSRDPERLRSQACAFYYMHNLNIGDEDLELRDRMMAFYIYMMTLEVPGRVFDSAEMGRIFSGLENAAAFRRFIANMAHQIHRPPIHQHHSEGA